jgi:hypothetical protein
MLSSTSTDDYRRKRDFKTIKTRTDEQVFIHKFTFLCVGSTSFLDKFAFFVCRVNKQFSLISFLDKFNSRVYGQQALLDKFTFSCERSTSFP